MAGSFNVMDLEQFIREYMKEYIKQSQPDMDISENSAFDDIFIKPMIAIMRPIFPLLTNTELKSNLKFAKYLTDEEIEDIGVNNYAVYRDTGSAATALQTFGFSRVPERGITIPQGVVVSTQSGLMYTTSYSTTYSKAEMQKSFNAATQTYDITTFVTANGIGSDYNVGENMINICQTTFSEYLVYTTNKVAVTNGSDNESTDSYIEKCLTYYVNQHLGTAPGYRRDLLQKAKQLTDIKVIGYLDKGMERDTIEIVEKDVDNKTVFGDRVQGADGDYYRYAVTRSKHIGGCVDIYVRGSEYAVETLQSPINSNILCFDGPVNESSLKITKGSGSNVQDVPFLAGYISDPTKPIADYSGEAVSNIVLPEGVTEADAEEMRKKAESVGAQILFQAIFENKTPSGPLAFQADTVYPLKTELSINGETITLSYAAYNQSPVSISAGTISVSGEESAWGEMESKKFEIAVTVTCSYKAQSYTFDKKFVAAAVKNDTVTSIASYAEFADKVILFVSEVFAKPTQLSVAYTFLDKDAPQDIITEYTVGYDDKILELKAPLSESLLSVYYESDGVAWTDKDFNAWAAQLSKCPFTDFSSILSVANATDDAKDLIDAIRLLRYRLSMSRIIEGEETDDDGFPATHDIHKFDSYYKDSSQEKIYVTLSNGSDMSQFQNIFQLLPNTSASADDAFSGLSIQYSYNNTLHNIQTSMFEDDDRIITADVLVKEAARTPVNVAMKINIKNGAELTSAMRAQIQAAVSQLFSDAGINGKIEQSDIVGKLYTDPTTSAFVEYVRLALDAFYTPDDVNAEIVNNNEGDYIQADEKSYLYLNKLLIDVLDSGASGDTIQIKKLLRVNRIDVASTMSGLIFEGEHILNRNFDAVAIDKNGTEVEGSVNIISVNGDAAFSETAEKTSYNVCFEFVANQSGYSEFYTNKTIEVV